MSEIEKIIYTFLRMRVSDAGAEDNEISKKWLKATTELLNKARHEGFGAFLEVWSTAVSSLPADGHVDKALLTKEVVFRMLYDLLVNFRTVKA